MIIKNNKHQFLLTLNTTFSLVIFSFLLSILEHSLRPLANTMQTNPIHPMITLAQHIYLVSEVLNTINGVLSLAWFLLIVKEVKTRGFLNYLFSVFETISLRRFLKSSSDGGTWSYNKAVSQSVVEINDKGVSVAIKLPTTYADQAHLQQFEATIMNELTYRHPDYFFSSPMREKNILWVSGTKR